MAEIILHRRKAASVLNEPNPLIILLILSLLQLCGAQVVNRVPHFIPQTGDMSQFSIPEDTPVGTPVYHLKGIDPDDGPLRYSISGQYFSVDSTTGVVTLAKALDRELESSLEVIISITDEGISDTEPNTVSLRRVIPVRDVNDNPPVFHNRPYIVNISEALPVGSEIEVTPNIIVTDLDEGDNARITVECSTEEKGGDVEACSTFKIVTEMLTPNKYVVRLYLAAALDYEGRAALVLALRARDAGRPPRAAAARVAAALRDVQDAPPAFLSAPHAAALPENTPPNTSVMEIIAKDGDTANPRPVLLTLEGDGERYFKLVPERPVGRATLVTAGVPLDRESDVVVQNGGVYNFFVKATELINNEVPADFSVAPVTIVVGDEDDHAPAFSARALSAAAPEHAARDAPLPTPALYVDDPDLPHHARYNLSLRNVFNSEGVFTLSPDHGEGRTPISIKVNDSSKLEYDVEDEEKRMFIFDVVASVHGEEKASSRITVKLLDINDNAPIFDKPQYKFNVLENSPADLKIGDVHAKDRDYGIFGEIEYSLTGFGAEMFKTDKVNGGLFVANNLDYEMQKSYSLTMTAKDGGGKSTTVSVYVDVDDMNDNAPVFEAAEYSRTVREGATSFEPQLIVRATDADGPAQGGGRVRYSLADGDARGVSVHARSGELRLLHAAHAADTPRGEYVLVVRATDYGTPPLYNETKVYIRVGVPGNQRPTFKGNFHHYKYTGHSKEDFVLDANPMNYKARVREDARAGHNVTAVRAHDPDGLDDLLTYHIVRGSKDNFVINEKTGLITVSNDANLDRDVNPDRYEIIVSAVDSGVPVPETATTTVFVTIEDVNDKPPVFNLTESTTYISERTKIDEVVTKIVAHDSDLTSKLKYSLLSIKAFSKAGVQLKENSNYKYKDIFKINEDSGEILVNGTLDYSQASIVILTIKVTDVNAEINKDKQFAVTEHTVYIQPYADKNPQFTNPGWTGSNPVIHHKVKEDQPIGSTVLVLMAEDPTSGHVVSNFKVINSETGLLQVDPLSGQVVLTKYLDYEELTNPNLTLTVQATSNDGSKHSTAKIIIEVVNINDNTPVFEKEVYKVSVLESALYPEPLLAVRAADADAVLSDEDRRRGFADVRYALRGDHADLLVIDDVTGVVRVAPNKSLDREQQSVLRATVEAADAPAGGPRRAAHALLLLDVLDVDDNPPAFDKAVYTAVVPENVPVGTLVVRLTATDPDEGLAGEVRYELLDEGEAAGLFAIDATSGEVRTRRALAGRGRTAPYRLAAGARAGDPPRRAAAALALYVGDVSANDGVPAFIAPAVGEEIVVSENVTIGTVVYQVVASDPDDPETPAGQLVYSIQPGNDDAADVFEIDAARGTLRTRRALDRERRAAYTLVLAAADRGRPPQRAARVAALRVADVDDHRPHFARRALDDPPIVMTIKEEVPIGTVIGTIEAIDEDIDENAEIDYVIIAGNELNLFSLQRTADSRARVVAAARLDREAAARALLTVQCFKRGAAPPPAKPYNRLDPAEIQVLIKIIDIDDHLPEFDATNMTVGVRLNVPTHTVIATVKAIDKDPDALPIEYKIINMTFQSPIKSKSLSNVTDVIELNSSSGELKIVKNLIHYADGTFWLTVRANNSNETDRYTDLSIEVAVVRARELLRLALPARRAGSLAAALAPALAARRLRLQLHDAPRPDPAGPCFQFRKMDTGEALTPKAMKSVMRSMGAELQRVLAAHDVRNVTACAGEGGGESGTRGAAVALLAVAAALPVAALLALVVLCCMHASAKRRLRSALLAREAPAAGLAPPSRLYAEPLYST